MDAAGQFSERMRLVKMIGKPCNEKRSFLTAASPSPATPLAALNTDTSCQTVQWASAPLPNAVRRLIQPSHRLAPDGGLLLPAAMQETGLAAISACKLGDAPDALIAVLSAAAVFKYGRRRKRASDESAHPAGKFS